MKRIVFLIALGWLTNGAWAGRVGEQAALKKASTFMKSHSRTRGAAAFTRVYLPLETKSAIWSTTDAPLYVFNKDGGGYVIVSGDDRTADILAFSDKGHIDANHLPVNMKSWLQGYVDQIERIPASATPRRVATRTGDTKEYLETKLKTTWGQDYPYNLHTPELSFSWADRDTTIHAATGCVATAMAMILHYFKYPDRIREFIPSYEGTCDIPMGNKETGEADTIKNVKWITEDIFAETPIRWAYIVDNYDILNTETQKPNNQYHNTDDEREAVSRLMQYCGAAVEMEYGIDSSSTTEQLLFAMKKVMGYQDAYVLISFEFDYQGWVDAVYYEMSKVGPVMFRGTTPSGGGHRFILDGYLSADDNDYFYVNWGWDGENNGYVLLSVMEPDSQWVKDADGNPEGFILNQDMICGLGPDGKGCTTLTNPKFYADALQFGLVGNEYSRNDKSEPFEITEYYLQFGNYNVDFLTQRVGLGVYDANNELVNLTEISEEEGATSVLFYYNIVQSVLDPFPIGADLDDGTYTLMLICADPYTENWEPMQNAEALALQMTITDNTCCFKTAGTTAIRKVMSETGKENADNAWYSLSGARLAGKPTTKGVYIHQGRKVMSQ